MRYAPGPYRELAKDLAEVRNIGGIGSDHNYGFFTSCQINLASPMEQDSAVGLEKDLGVAGLSHTDRGDHIHHLSAMLAFGSLRDLHPGHFGVSELGIAARLENYRLIYFSARRKHGATPARPEAPNGNVQDQDVRATCIWYPERAIVERSAANVIGFMGERSRLEVNYSCLRSPEILKGIQNYQTFARDNYAVMSGEGSARHLSRELLILILIVLQQASGNIRRAWIDDVQAFMKSFRFEVEDEDGSTRLVEGQPWDLAPGQTEAIDLQRAQIEAKLVSETIAVCRTFAGEVARWTDEDLRSHEMRAPNKRPFPAGKSKQT